MIRVLIGHDQTTDRTLADFPGTADDLVLVGEAQSNAALTEIDSDIDWSIRAATATPVTRRLVGAGGRGVPTR